MTVNGATRPLGEPMAVVPFIEQFGLNPAHVALELNGQIVRRAAWPETQIRPGDTVELVHFVGGG